MFLQRLISSVSGKVFKKGGITKTNKLCNLFLAILCHCQDFLRKLPKLVVIRNACIVYTQLWDAIFNPFEILVFANKTIKS